MKKITIIILSIALIFSACSEKKSGYAVKGTLENGSGKTIYFNELNTTSIEPIDSTKINDVGAFLFEGTTSSPFFAILQLGNNNFITIVVDSTDNIEINGDANNIAETYTVKGSKDSELIRELNLQLNTVLKQVDSIASIFNANRDNEMLDSIKTELDKSYSKIMNTHRQFVAAFIDKNDESLASIMALYQQVRRTPVFNIKSDYELFKKVDNTLMKKYPNSKHTKALHANLIEAGKVIDANKTSVQNTEVGSEAPDITLPTPEGNTISLSDFKGQYVLLDFWAAWCRPCRAENPNLVANYKKYHDKGFDIFQVSLDKTKEDWISAIKKDGLTWNHVSDLKYWNSAPARMYKVSSIPANFLLDKEGKIIARDLRGSALGQKLAAIFN